MNAFAIAGLGALFLFAISRRGAGVGEALSRAPLTPERARALFSREAVVEAIKAMMAVRPSIPAWFAFAMAEKESGFDPGALGDRGISYGIYQINWRAHGAKLEGRNVSKDMLYDPRVNATYWGELASGLGTEALSHGFSAEGAARWKAVRLKLKGGFAWDEMGSARAAEALVPFGPIATRWQEFFA